MLNIRDIEPFVGILTCAVISGAWWFAAIKSPHIWLFRALAGCTTAQTTLFAILFYQVELHQRLTYFHALSHAQAVLGILEAGFYILLVRWLVRTLTKDHVA
jgi:hypothetical protein